MKVKLTILAMLISGTVLGQVSGNVNYQNQVRLSDQNIHISAPSNMLAITVKGIANVKADAYVAIFSVTQVGKTTEEVNNLMDNRISTSLKSINALQGTETYVDMISLVPIYEFVVEKKIFSPKNYTEIPTGFELKKSIHIKYTDQKQLEDFICTLSTVEIYDLVRVDYFSSDLEKIKIELRDKAKLLIEGKIKNYETILGRSFSNDEKLLSDGFKVVLPVEMYKSYEAYNSTSLNLKKQTVVNQVDKSTTLYYQPVLDKEFDFVINPVILEPVIQVMYQVNLTIATVKEEATPTKEYMFITPNGEIKNLNIVK